jgi:hypothetical protein
VHEAISFALPGIADERAHQGFGRELTTHFVRDMDEGFAAKDAETGQVRLVAAPSFFRCGVAERASRRGVVKQGRIPKGVPPVSIWKVSVDEHRPDPFDKRTVHPFCNPVMLWCVGSGELVLDPLVPEERLDFPGDVLAPSIGAQDFESLAGLEFDSSDEGAQVLDHLGLLLHGVDENFARFVVDPGDKVEKALMGASGEKHANVRENSAEDFVGTSVSLSANLSTCLLALDTGFANVRGRGVTTYNLHALCHPLACHADDVVGVKVTEATVPDVDGRPGAIIVSDQRGLRGIFSLGREGGEDRDVS